MEQTRKQQPVRDNPGEEPAKLRFSVPQLIGSALAAATAAFLGSRLGTAGTILGAGLASVVAAVAGTLYTVGLDRTTRRLSTVVKRGWERTRGEDPSASLEAGEGLDLVVDHHDPGTMAPVPTGAVQDEAATSAARKVIGKRVLVGALGIFALAIVVVTGVELVTGQSLSGGSGTTVTDVVRPRPPASQEPSPSVAPTGTTSTEPVPSASPSESEAPASTPTPSPTPTSVTQPEPTPTPAPEEPTATAGPAEGSSGTETGPADEGLAG